LLELEREVLGMDHTELGAAYIKRQKLPEVFVETVQFHHRPEGAENHGKIVAAVQVADLLVRHANIGDSGNRAEVPADSWLESSGWKILFGQQTPGENTITRATLRRSLDGIPHMLEGLV
jgi:HD-like signal output (HDOD) protein